MERLKGISILVFALAGVFLLSERATAQYPPPSGSITATAGDPSPEAGSATTITSRLLGTGGVAVGGTLCTFTIVSAPGSDATLSSGAAVTDSQGYASVSLNAGSTPGFVTVGVACGGMQTTLIVEVLGAALPPAAPIGPPSTGDGGLL